MTPIPDEQAVLHPSLSPQQEFCPNEGYSDPARETDQFHLVAYSIPGKVMMSGVKMPLLPDKEMEGKFRTGQGKD